MRVISTNVGVPRTYEFQGATVQTSMRRHATAGGITIHLDRVDGDEFAVPKFHGNKEAVVYAFSFTEFAPLSRLYEQAVGAGNVGENLTIDSLDESSMMIGDEYEVGTARLRVTGPRYPCNRLNFTFQRADAMALFAKHRRPGVYFEVVREGRVAVGDELRLVRQAGGETSVLELFDGLTAMKEFVAKRLTKAKLAPIAEQLLRNPLIPDIHLAKFRKVLGAPSFT